MKSVCQGRDAGLSPAAQFYFSDQWVLPGEVPVWWKSPLRLPHCRLVDTQFYRDENGERKPLRFAQPLPSNRAWFDARTLEWWQQRRVSLQGEMLNGVLQVQGLWPEDWLLPEQAVGTRQTLQQLVQAMDAPLAPFQVHTLWRRDPQPACEHVWALMLNGAQGDDDEAHGGHFSVVTGEWNGGNCRNWLAANFYNPDVVSEKGILPALTPLDVFLTDLNAGQQMYRPSLMLVARLKSARVLEPVRRALITTFSDLYSHRSVYHGSRNNCTGLTVDALRTAGFSVPERGATSRGLAPFLSLAAWLSDGKAAAQQQWAAFTTDRSRLLPVQAFYASAEHWLRLIAEGGTHDTERAFAHDVQQISCVRFPQWVSTRALGRSPVNSLWAYAKRVPVRRADWRVVPVPARPFPETLRTEP